MNNPQHQKSEFNGRKFLKNASLGITGLAALPAASFGKDNKQAAKAQTVALAIATITCDGFGDENFEKAFAIIPQLPFKNVEFNCWYARNLTPSGIRSI